MNIAMLCFSLSGRSTGERLLERMKDKGIFVTLESKSRYLPDSIAESTAEWTGRRFADSDAVIFIGSCGIAVRSIAPYVQSKKTDPAVLVIDECGRHVISLLSGHLGGANELTLLAAELLGAEPVITTATDLHERFAVDVFAKKNGCAIRNMKAAKEVSAALLAGRTVGFYSEFPYEGALPHGLSEEEKNAELGIAVTIHEDCQPFEKTVQVIPAAAALGMGCRRGKEAASVISAAEKAVEGLGLCKEAVGVIASIDLKKDEKGLHALAQAWNIPFVTYTKEELLQASGNFSASAFVQEITGIDNVCERSAVLAGGQGRLIEKKTGADGVTTAVAVKDWRVRFE